MVVVLSKDCLSEKPWLEAFTTLGLKIRDIKEIIDISSSPFDNDSMDFVGVFELINGKFALVTLTYSGTWDDVSSPKISNFDSSKEVFEWLRKHSR